MKMLDMSSTAEQVLEEFPMLDGASVPELILMRSDCEEIPEDEPFVRAIDILMARIEDGSYHTDDDEGDEPSLVGSRE